MEKALVICPGRGTYTATELGTLKRHGQGFRQLIDPLDEARRAAGQPTVTELDAAEAFVANTHTAGEHAAALIYACSLVDFHAIDDDAFEVVAVTGNSMGWYTALGLSAALDPAGAFELINTMGSMMKDEVVGGQLVYPEMDDQWRPDPERGALIDDALNAVAQLDGCQVFDSIYFGGYRVIGGNDAGLTALSQRLPKVDARFPLRLVNHAAFHTPLMGPTSQRAMSLLSSELFGPPNLPLIDGRGHIWQPYSTKPEALWRYTLGHQVVEPYDFTQALTVGLKEFAPTKLILLGPGTTLGGAVGQTLVRHRWLGIETKDQFLERQERDPYLLTMAREAQRALVDKSAL